MGSTAFKQKNHRHLVDDDGTTSSPAEPWFSPIAQFYRGIEQTFSKEWHLCKEAAIRHGWDPGSSPELWKSVGDELIYTKLLTDHRQSLLVVNAWISAIKEFRDTLRQQFPALDLKSTAWIAGFPVHNAEVVFSSQVDVSSQQSYEDDPVISNLLLLKQYKENERDPSLTRDFIGPAIDTGFRLSQFSNPRQMVVSADLLSMLINSVRIQPPDFYYKPLSFFYEGRKAMKGVFGGVPYPIFWLDMKADPALELSEDQLNGREPLSTDRIKAFCEAFIASNELYSFVPYIVANPDPYFSRMPPAHEVRLRELKTYWSNEMEKRQEEDQSAKLSDDSENGGSSTLPNTLEELREFAKAVADIVNINRSSILRDVSRPELKVSPSGDAPDPKD